MLKKIKSILFVIILSFFGDLPAPIVKLPGGGFKHELSPLSQKILKLRDGQNQTLAGKAVFDALVWLTDGIDSTRSVIDQLSSDESLQSKGFVPGEVAFVEQNLLYGVYQFINDPVMKKLGNIGTTQYNIKFSQDRPSWDMVEKALSSHFDSTDPMAQYAKSLKNSLNEMQREVTQEVMIAARENMTDLLQNGNLEFKKGIFKNDCLVAKRCAQKIKDDILPNILKPMAAKLKELSSVGDSSSKKSSLVGNKNAGGGTKEPQTDFSESNGDDQDSSSESLLKSVENNSFEDMGLEDFEKIAEEVALGAEETKDAAVAGEEKFEAPRESGRRGWGKTLLWGSLAVVGLIGLVAIYYKMISSLKRKHGDQQDKKKKPVVVQEDENEDED